MTEPKQWLTPKSDSFESFVFFVLRVVTVLAFVGATVYLAIVGTSFSAFGSALLAATAALVRRG